MACFLVPGTEAIVVTAAALLLRKHEQNKVKPQLNHPAGAAPTRTEGESGFSKKLFWLAGLLWGGVVLLAFEHLWHGEIQPFFPFLTAASEGSAAVSEMLHEMSTVGVTMALLVTAFWAAMIAVSAAIEKRPARQSAEVEA